LAPERGKTVMPDAPRADTLRELDGPTRELVRLSAIVSAGSDAEVRAAMAPARERVPADWVEELLLQSYLFAGFPRALNAMREWRRMRDGPVAETQSGKTHSWRDAGEVTCAAVYGDMYHRLRENIRALHPLLDEWMIVEGYGKVLSRPGLDLGRRELCIVAACAATNQDRQLHSHLRGALNVGVEPAVIDAALEAIADVLGDERARGVGMLWARVRGK
jgi:4-carboxymuconolactone decarboxylase